MVKHLDFAIRETECFFYIYTSTKHSQSLGTSKKKKMTRQEAKNKLYELWENGEIPSNFTEDHSEYERAVEQMMKYGEIEYSDFF